MAGRYWLRILAGRLPAGIESYAELIETGRQSMPIWSGTISFEIEQEEPNRVAEAIKTAVVVSTEHEGIRMEAEVDRQKPSPFEPITLVLRVTNHSGGLLGVSDTKPWITYSLQRTKLSKRARKDDREFLIIPPGPRSVDRGGHVTPSDHLGVAPKRQGERAADVIAMADGFLVDIQRSMPGNPDPAARGRDAGTHRLVFEHSGTFYSYIGLVDELADHVLDAAGGDVRPGPPVGLRLPVKAGEVVGRLTGDHGLDFAVMNTEVSLAGFAVPERFQMRDMWKIHTVDPYDYIDEPMRGRLLALNPRQAKPLGGKIDYDVDGRLVGNWYREGSGGYAARRGQLDYWVGHLAIVYHHIDPTKVTVSVGDWQGSAAPVLGRGQRT